MRIEHPFFRTPAQRVGAILGPVFVVVCAATAVFGAGTRAVSTEVKDKRWLDKFAQMRRLDRKIREAFPDVFRDEPAAYERPAIEAESTVDLYEAMLGRELAALSATVNRLAASRRPPQPVPLSHVQIVRRIEDTYDIAFPSTASVENVSVRLTNKGRIDVVNPRLIANGRRDWFDVESIKREALPGVSTDRDKAVALWRFLAENRYHFTPAHNSHELHDPVRFLNVYGFGFCDDSAANFAALARSAGLGGRVWGLSGHVVAEAEYDGAWHLFDPDGKMYYRKEDGRTIASVEDCARNPELMRNPVTVGRQPYGFDSLKRLYTSTDDNKVSDWYRRTSSTSHRMAFVLRPGETIVRHWKGDGRFFTSRYFEEPPVYGVGEWIYEPPFEEELFRAGAESAKAIRVGKDGDRPAIRAAGDGAFFTHAFRLPYPLLDGCVEIVHASGDEENAVTVAVAAGAGEEHRVWTGRGVGERRALVAVGCCFPNGYGDPAYRCTVRIGLERRKGNLAIRRLRYRFVFQVAPASLPALEAGANRLRFCSEGRKSPALEIEHQYRLDAGP